MSRVLLALGLVALASVSVLVEQLALFVGFGAFLFLVTLPADHDHKRLLVSASILALVLSVVGVGRFVAKHALTGIAEASKRGSEKSIISRLHEIHLAESKVVQRGAFDRDHDGKGSAAWLGELAGVPSRRAADLPTPLLDRRFRPTVATDEGPAAPLNGHLVLVCLPTSETNYTAKPDGKVDENRAEEEFWAVAWPQHAHAGHARVFAIGAKGQVFVHGNRSKDGTPRYVGERAPPCSVVARGAEEGFSRWTGR